MRPLSACSEQREVVRVRQLLRCLLDSERCDADAETQSRTAEFRHPMSVNSLRRRPAARATCLGGDEPKTSQSDTCFSVPSPDRQKQIVGPAQLPCSPSRVQNKSNFSFKRAGRQCPPGASCRSLLSSAPPSGSKRHIGSRNGNQRALRTTKRVNCTVPGSTCAQAQQIRAAFPPCCAESVANGREGSALKLRNFSGECVHNASTTVPRPDVSDAESLPPDKQDPPRGTEVQQSATQPAEEALTQSQQPTKEMVKTRNWSPSTMQLCDITISNLAPLRRHEACSHRCSLSVLAASARSETSSHYAAAAEWQRIRMPGCWLGGQLTKKAASFVKAGASTADTSREAIARVTHRCGENPSSDVIAAESLLAESCTPRPSCDGDCLRLQQQQLDPEFPEIAPNYRQNTTGERTLLGDSRRRGAYAKQRGTNARAPAVSPASWRFSSEAKTGKRATPGQRAAVSDLPENDERVNPVCGLCYSAEKLLCAPAEKPFPTVQEDHRVTLDTAAASVEAGHVLRSVGDGLASQGQKSLEARPKAVSKTASDLSTSAADAVISQHYKVALRPVPEGEQATPVDPARTSAYHRKPMQTRGGCRTAEGVFVGLKRCIERVNRLGDGGTRDVAGFFEDAVAAVRREDRAELCKIRRLLVQNDDDYHAAERFEGRTRKRAVLGHGPRCSAEAIATETGLHSYGNGQDTQFSEHVAPGGVMRALLGSLTLQNYAIVQIAFTDNFALTGKTVATGDLLQLTACQSPATASDDCKNKGQGQRVVQTIRVRLVLPAALRQLMKPAALARGQNLQEKDKNRRNRDCKDGAFPPLEKPPAILLVSAPRLLRLHKPHKVHTEGGVEAAANELPLLLHSGAVVVNADADDISDVVSKRFPC